MFKFLKNRVLFYCAIIITISLVSCKSTAVKETVITEKQSVIKVEEETENIDNSAETPIVKEIVSSNPIFISSDISTAPPKMNEFEETGVTSAVSNSVKILDDNIDYFISYSSEPNQNKITTINTIDTNSPLEKGTKKTVEVKTENIVVVSKENKLESNIQLKDDEIPITKENIQNEEVTDISTFEPVQEENNENIKKNIQKQSPKESLSTSAVISNVNKAKVVDENHNNAWWYLIIAIIVISFIGIRKKFSKNVKKIEINKNQRISKMNSNLNNDEMFTKNSDEIKNFKISFGINSSSNIKGPMHWIPINNTINYLGYKIDCGMLYIGTANDDPADCLINTKKPVLRLGNYYDNSMGYWPNYSTISSSSRSSYLSWLESGMSDSGASVGYLFLYFYGLERRILKDYSLKSSSIEELNQIYDKVKTLLSVYGKESRSVRGYFNNFLDFLTILKYKKVGNTLTEDDLVDLKPEYYCPCKLQIVLGQLAQDKVPMSSNLAYLWITNDCSIKLYPILKNHPEVFHELFCLKYNAHYKEGILLPITHKKIAKNYNTASSSLFSETEYKVSIDLPDTTIEPSIRDKLQELIEECRLEMKDCGCYKNMQQSNSLSFERLPVELLVSKKNDKINELKNRIEKESVIYIKLSQLLSDILNTDILTKESLPKISRVLEKKKILLEPDILAYKFNLGLEDNVMLFKSEEKIPQPRSNDNYLLNILFVELAQMVASADGEVDNQEFGVIYNYISNLDNLDPYFLTRLRMHLSFLQKTEIKESSIKKQLKILSPDLVISLLTSLNQVVMANGKIDFSEMKLLEKIYKYLNIDKAILTHSLQNPEEVKTEAKQGLDYEKIDKLKKESTEISSILSEIFTANEEAEPEIIEPIVEDAIDKDNQLKLDANELNFFNQLISRPKWTRAELLVIAKENGLMLDGTLELINERALDLFDTNVVEGEDDIEIMEDFLRSISW